MRNDVVLVSLLLTLNRYYTLLWSFHCYSEQVNTKRQDFRKNYLCKKNLDEVDDRPITNKLRDTSYKHHLLTYLFLAKGLLKENLNPNKNNSNNNKISHFLVVPKDTIKGIMRHKKLQ